LASPRSNLLAEGAQLARSAGTAISHRDHVEAWRQYSRRGRLRANLAVAVSLRSRREADAMERFFEAHHVLLSAGKMAETSVRRLCEHNEGPCGMAELIALRNGLAALAAR
jgi:hypothetical protein